VISPQLGQSSFMAFSAGGIVWLQLLQMGVCIMVEVLVSVLMVVFSFECRVYIERLLISAMFDCDRLWRKVRLLQKA